uniref:Uncharacterized protein n=1 Tax=Poecilia mexicana TaxID=48701 RepID=A0A3B3YWC9_9TELE
MCGSRFLVTDKESVSLLVLRLRPYHPEHARSRLISEAKQGRAWSVLGWETAWEYQVGHANSVWTVMTYRIYYIPNTDSIINKLVSFTCKPRG